jgi:hypothetical protein
MRGTYIQVWGCAHVLKIHSSLVEVETRVIDYAINGGGMPAGLPGVSGEV